MDFFTLTIAITFIALAIQFGEIWMVVGATFILIIASNDMKVTVLLVVSVIVLYLINGIGMKDYWLIAVLALVALGYLFGLGKEAAAPQDPYAGLLGGMGGGEGMGM